MRLLVTRPEPDAQETAARLAALGHDVLVQPLLTITFRPAPPDLPDPAALVVTSRNGARALARWPRSRGWHDQPVFVTGPATGRQVAELGFTDVRVGAGDGAALAGLIRADLSPGDGPLLHIAGRDRGSGLPDGLAGGGYDLRAIEAYQADMVDSLQPAVREALRRRTLGGVLLYSPRSATAFREIITREGLGTALAGVMAFVISPEAGAALEPLQLDVRIAERPDEDSLIGLIPPPK